MSSTVAQSTAISLYYASTDSSAERSSTEELRELIDGYVYLTVTVETPGWGASIVYKSVLAPDEATYDEICSFTPLEFAPGLLGVLKSSTPPSFQFFTTLPDVPVGRKIWGDYAVCLVKPGSRPKLYFGSGTNAQSGVKGRFSNYDLRNMLPVKINEALQEGYTIVHRGLLCWGDIPPPAQAPRVLTRILALEGFFTFMFFRGIEHELEHLWTSFMPWTRDQVEWDPLCTHTCLTERPRGVELSEEQLEQQAAFRKARTAAISKKFEDKERATDLQAHLARKAREKLAWTNRNKEKVLETAAGVRARAKASNKHRCDTCNLSLASPLALEKHLDTAAHKKQVSIAAGTYIQEPDTPEVARAKARMADKKKRMAFACAICDRRFAVRSHLIRHNKSLKHLAKVQAASKSSSKPAVATNGKTDERLEKQSAAPKSSSNAYSLDPLPKAKPQVSLMAWLNHPSKS